MMVMNNFIAARYEFVLGETKTNISLIFRNMKKNIIASLVGVAVSQVVNMCIVFLALIMGPSQFRNVDMSNKEAFLEAMQSMTAADYMWPLAAHILGVFAGLTVARMMCRSSHIPIYVVATIHIILTIINLTQIPHPTWFAILDVLVPIGLTFAFLQLKLKK